MEQICRELSSRPVWHIIAIAKEPSGFNLGCDVELSEETAILLGSYINRLRKGLRVGSSKSQPELFYFLTLYRATDTMYEFFFINRNLVSTADAATRDMLLHP